MSCGNQFVNFVSGMGLSDVSSLHKEFSVNSDHRRLCVKQLGTDVFIYASVPDKAKKRELTEAQKAVLKGEKFKGEVTPRIRKKVLETIRRWQLTLDYHNSNLSKYQQKQFKQIVLLTLTLSSKQTHTDKWIKRNLLSPFIQELQKSLPDFNYIWKAEKQQNGNLHFHLLIDAYIDKALVQIMWNRQQQKKGYHPSGLLDDENLGCPSTKIEGLRNKRNAVAYVAKYISKDEQSGKIDGRVWGCSDNLKSLKTVVLDLSHAEAEVLMNAVATPDTKLAVYDYCIHITKCKTLDMLNYPHQAVYMMYAALRYNYSCLFDAEKRRADDAYKQVSYDDFLIDSNSAWLDAVSFDVYS